VPAGCTSGAGAWPPRSASALGLRCPPPRRSLAGSSRAHWRGPGAAPALTPGRPVTSRREGGGSCIFMRRGHRRGVARSPPRGSRFQLSSAIALRPALSTQSSCLTVRSTSLPKDPGGRLRGAL
jgi:hypothetical protein